MATIIKGSTKRGANLLWSTEYAEGVYLDDVYTSCSGAKYRGYRACREIYGKMVNASGFRITSHNTFRFTVAWECEVEYLDPKTGKVTMEKARYIKTADNDYIVLLDR